MKNIIKSTSCWVQSAKKAGTLCVVSIYHMHSALITKPATMSQCHTHTARDQAATVGFSSTRGKATHRARKLDSKVCTGKPCVNTRSWSPPLSRQDVQLNTPEANPLTWVHWPMLPSHLTILTSLKYDPMPGQAEHTISLVLLCCEAVHLGQLQTTAAQQPQPHKQPSNQHHLSHHHSAQAQAAQKQHRNTAASKGLSTGVRKLSGSCSQQVTKTKLELFLMLEINIRKVLTERPLLVSSQPVLRSLKLRKISVLSVILRTLECYQLSKLSELS